MAKLPQKNEIQKAVQDFITAKKLSKNDLAKKLGISPATLSLLETGKWDSLSSEMLIKIWTYVKPSSWQLIPTANFNSVFSCCEDARKRHRLVAVIGSEGLGKTKALEYYYRTHPNTYYVLYSEFDSIRDFIGLICKEMSIQYLGKPGEMIRLIADELNSKARPLLIIDEADKMNNKAFMLIHVLRNATMENAGIVLAGVEFLKENLEKQVLRKKRGMAEFYSRIASWQPLQRPTRQEIKEICLQNGLADMDIIKSFYQVPHYRLLEEKIKNQIP